MNSKLITNRITSSICRYSAQLTKIALLSVLSLCLSLPCFAQPKEIAITVDDLPFVGEYRNFHLNMIIEALKAKQAPATGFIIAKEVRPDNWEVLQKFREAGFGLGNHTFSHANLNQLKTRKYYHEIKEADDILQPVMTEPKYFRYPYLAMSTGKKRNKVLCYLNKKNYQVAPITIDSKDFFFNMRLLATPEVDRRAYLQEMRPFYLDFIWSQTLKAEEHNHYIHNPEQAQILLIHANLLNAYVLPDILELYRSKGYKFVTLEDALKTFKQKDHCVKTKLLNVIPKPDLGIESFFDWD